MEQPLPRRRFLSAAAVGVTGSALGTGLVRGNPPDGPDDWFDPALNGFGFRNWTTQSETVTQSVGTVPEDDIREIVVEEWREPVRESVGLSVENFPQLLISIISKQIYTSVNQLSGTNGHCYGMVFTAQRYYEQPDAIPLGRDSASEFTHPAEPVEDPITNPVLEEIEWFHSRQFVDFYGWLGRRAVFRPAWIDYQTQVADIRATVDQFGTAGITIVDSSDRTQHQVLVYDYDQQQESTILYVYDPNQRAPVYSREGGLRRIEIDFSGEEPRMLPYGRGYDTLVFNRFDRLVRARAEAGSPIDGFTVTEEALQEFLFSIALFLIASPTVSMVVLGPEGRPLGRDRSVFMDTDRGDYDDIRYRFGADPGTYRIVLFGEEDGDYSLEAMAASPTEELLEETVSGSIGAGEVHRYDAIVPENPEEEGHVERVRGDRTGLDPRIAAGAGAAGTAIAIGAYRMLANRHSERDGSGSGPD